MITKITISIFFLLFLFGWVFILCHFNRVEIPALLAGHSVKQVMPKGEEQKAALNTLKAMKKRSGERARQVKKAAKALGKSYADHGAGRAEADAIDHARPLWKTAPSQL